MLQRQEKETPKAVREVNDLDANPGRTCHTLAFRPPC